MKAEMRDKLAKSLLLYAVTDDRWNGNRSLLDLIEDALEGGCTLVQLREKNMSEWSANRSE